MWTCSKCSTRLGDKVYVCWRCGTSGYGEVDPHFVFIDMPEPSGDPDDYLGLDVGKRPIEVTPGETLELNTCFSTREIGWAKLVSSLLATQGIPSNFETIDERGEVGGRVLVKVEDNTRTKPVIIAFLARLLSKHV